MWIIQQPYLDVSNKSSYNSIDISKKKVADNEKSLSIFLGDILPM